MIAERVRRLVNGTLPWPSIDPEKALPWIERKTGLSLAESQIAAIRLALMSKVLVVTGGPGVGNTTIVNAILRILAAEGVDLLLCAPTGRAAKRMTEATGFEAKTIHRLLDVDQKTGGFNRSSDHPLECDLLVVDETSMVDVLLMQALLKAVPDDAALLIVGDIDQLPSVGPGQALADVIASGAVPVVRLTEVFRQAAQSRIITSAHRINRGSLPDLTRREGDSDFYFVQADDPEIAVARIVELMKTRIPQRFGLDPIRDIQVLCPMNRGGIGARSLNIELQTALNPSGDRKVKRFGWTFAPGDKVMQIENDYDKEVYNGDIGYIDEVDQDSGELIVRFDGRNVTYGFGELDTLVPAYAVTIHKSQGSEYSAVVIPVLTQHYTMLQRNLRYTGVTRGKRLVVLVGQRKAIAIAVRNVGGLFDRPHGGGAPRKLTAVQGSDVAGWVRSGPEPGRDGMVRWRRSDLGQKIARTFGVHLHERSVGKLLHRLGFRHLSVRPRHPQADSLAHEAHKKTLPHWSLTPSRPRPGASRSSSGGRMKHVSASKAA